jgi:hypothetical protein
VGQTWSAPMRSMRPARSRYTARSCFTRASIPDVPLGASSDAL